MLQATKVHLNPVRARLIKAEQLKEDNWSSYPEYLKAPFRRRAWLRTDRLLELGRAGRTTPPVGDNLSGQWKSERGDVAGGPLEGLGPAR